MRLQWLIILSATALGVIANHTGDFNMLRCCMAILGVVTLRAIAEEEKK